MKDKNYAHGGHDFNDIYSVLEDDENTTNDEDLTIVESDVEEDEGETYVS